jgi:hypothetical protein
MPHDDFHEVITHVRQSFDGDRSGFSLFLGAGASKSSGVPLADELADIAFETSFRGANTVDPTEPPADIKQRVRDWVEVQPWYDKDLAKYSLAMEHALITPGIRAKFLEKQTQAARPSPGYLRLAQLLGSRVFDTIYTTNFDDLMFRAWAKMFSERLVEVASLDQYPLQNPSPQKPRLLRLHGDYHHGNVLNTEGELEKTPSIRYRTVHRLSCPQGMIVIGYGGRDHRIMEDLFGRYLKTDRNFLKNGLFWCIQRGSELPVRVQDLRRAGGDRVHVIKIDGFDQAMEALATGFELHADALLPESLRSAVEDTALLADASKLLTDSTNDLPALACGIENAFFKLSRQVAARSAILIAVDSDVARVVCAVNASSVLNAHVPVTFAASLADRPAADISSSELARSSPLAMVLTGMRTVAYPVTCEGQRLGVVLFSFDPSGQGSQKEERVIAALGGLLVLAAKRFLDKKQLLMGQRATAFWNERGCPEGSPEIDWSKAEAELKAAIDSCRNSMLKY